MKQDSPGSLANQQLAQMLKNQAEASRSDTDNIKINPHSLFGISFANFLKWIQTGRRNCLVDVTSGTSKGHLTFCDGELWNADSGDYEGDDAVYEMLGWNDPAFVIHDFIPEAEMDRNMVLSVAHSIRLWEAFSPNTVKNSENERRNAQNKASEEKSVALPSAVSEGRSSVKTDINSHKENYMAIEKHLTPLRDIKGYKASGIMNFTGEVVAYDSVDPGIDLGLVGATFNDIFRSAHEASKKIGLEACTEATIMTPKGTIVMTCSGVESKVHIHAIGIVSADGNQALMKMQLEKMMPNLIAEL